MNGGEATLPDAAARNRALDPGCSFIVQAPAGSGKTELLIQRFLALLSVVDEPEEILAITFTRKAATEMRTRILKALAEAQADEAPDEPHRMTAYRLARAALARDRERDWGLGAQPSRMQIGTIDSINLRLARRAPLSAGLTSMHELVEHPELLYREAARETIGLAADDDEQAAMLRRLLDYLDNRADQFEKLLANMLAQRDQWLRVTGAGVAADPQQLRAQLETALGDLAQATLGHANALVPDAERPNIVEILSYAAHAIADEKPDSELTAWIDEKQFPVTRIENLKLWRSMARAFLTDKGTWRARLTKNEGFPADGKAMKERARDLIADLARVPGLQDAFDEVRRLPDPGYTDAQWGALEALLHALPLAAANLKQLFAANRQTDYSEVAQEALAALGSEDEPSELGLALDYRIQHILLDEFQDTSRSQFELLTRMTAGWQPEAGRTLFLVGDPMQSIYRFREAEVGLFIVARKHGIGQMPLEFLQLQTNFRSDPAIVDWFNSVFAATFPRDEDPVSGAIGFAPSAAFRSQETGAGVSWHVVPYGDDDAEAAQVLTLVRDALSCSPDESIGILVRSRAHAAPIARALRAAGIEFMGQDVETIENHVVVQDLLALTRAMTHRADRLAWLAVLRAPWCGLSLPDLTALAGNDRKACVWDVIGRAGPATLSAAGWKRLVRVRDVLARNLEGMYIAPLRDSIEKTWLELGGPATLSRGSDLDLAERFFDFLDTVDAGGDSADNGALLDQLRTIARNDAPAAIDRGNVQVMTMHKAKGLEFDTVILPGLGYTTRGSDRPILLWQEFPRADRSDALAVAPMHATGTEGEGAYDYLWRVKRRMEALETDRLLYVSVTRARKRLRLLAPLNRQKDSNEPAEPTSGSLLSRIWPVVADQVGIEPGMGLPDKERRNIWQKDPDWFEIRPRCLPADWQPPELPAPCEDHFQAASIADPAELEFEWASSWAKHVGTIVHLWLQRIAEEGVEQFDRDRISGLRRVFRRMLRRLGTETENLDRAIERVTEALTNALDDETGRWVLSSRHADAANELPITAGDESDFEHLVIDRTFVDEDGRRWIVDYKTSTHEGGKLQEFLSSETERYKEKLRQYRDAVMARERQTGEPGEIRMALYFPLLKVFHEVDVDP